MLALFTEEQEILRDVVGDLARKIGLQNPSELETTDVARGWSEIQAMGLLGLRGRDGGQPLASGVEVMIAAEALATRLVPLPYLGAALLSSELLALVNAGSELQASVNAGDTRVCTLLSDDLVAPWIPPGQPVAWDCTGAELALSIDAVEGIVCCHRVTSLESLATADLTRTVATVGIGTTEGEWAISPGDIDRWHAFALVAISADIVGAMRGGLSGAIDYAKQREQFGTQVGSFQAVQHLCADAFVAIEGASSTLKYAAWAIDELQSDSALRAARTAKAFSAGVARGVAETMMQVYGGIGHTWEHIAHLYLRRQMLSSQVLGDASTQLRTIADERLGAA